MNNFINYRDEYFDNYSFKTSLGSDVYIDKHNCHKVTEIYPNFFLGGREQITDIIINGKKFDVLVPLDSLDPIIWKYMNPYKTEIFFFPCPDYGILNEKCLNYLVKHILKFIKKRKKTALFCLGGHGRTGYIAACVLGKLGIKNPVDVIRNNYCQHTIETYEQMLEVQEYTGVNLSKYLDKMLEKEFMDYLTSKVVMIVREEAIKEHNKKNKDKKADKIYYPNVNWVYKCSKEELLEICNLYGLIIPEKYSKFIE